MTEAGLGRVLNLSAPHGYVYGRWTNECVHVLMNHVMPRLGPRGKQWLADRYHGKVLTQDQAEGIIAIEQEIPLRDLGQIIPYPKARELVLKGAPDLGVWECPCRRIKDHPCEPSQVCVFIGQSSVDYHMAHNPGSVCSFRLTHLGAAFSLCATAGSGACFCLPSSLWCWAWLSDSSRARARRASIGLACGSPTSWQALSIR